MEGQTHVVIAIIKVFVDPLSVNAVCVLKVSEGNCRHVGVEGSEVRVNPKGYIHGIQGLVNGGSCRGDVTVRHDVC